MFLKKASKCRLLIVTGKGGVGKSLVAASLAKSLAMKGKKTLLVELTPENSACKFFSMQPLVNHFEEISSKLSLLRIHTDHILEEFFSERFHFKKIYKVFFDNRFVKLFLDATPGFNEFLIMSKLWQLTLHHDEQYDTVILDAPATGHACALLEVPQIVAEAVHAGPIRKTASKTLKLLRDHKKTGILIVSIPEEMPVTEAIHLQKEIRKLKLNSLGAVLNMAAKPIRPYSSKIEIPKKHKAVIDHLINERSVICKKQRGHIDKLKKTFKNDFIEVPFIHETDGAKLSDLAGKFFDG